MRVQSFNQFSQIQTGSFKLGNTKDENPTLPKRIVASPADLPPRKVSQNSVEFQIQKAMRKSANFLKKGLDKIFDNGEQLLAGRNREEYREHIKELGKAIQGQDSKRAEKLINRFYNGDTDEIITHIENLTKAAEDNFWDNIEEGLNFLKKDGLKWTLYVDGKERDDLSSFDLAKMAIKKSRNEADKFSSEDLDDLVTATRDGAVAHAKGKLKNAGQNKYSEDAYSVTHAATDYAKGKIFNTDDSNYEEDEKVLKDIDELYYNEDVTEEQLDRLRHQNTRKADKFTKFMRGSAEAFTYEFDKLKLAASPRVEEKSANSQEQTQAALSPMGQQLENGIDPQLMSLDVKGMLNSSQQNENTEKQAEKYTSNVTEEIYPSIDWKI